MSPYVLEPYKDYEVQILHWGSDSDFRVDKSMGDVSDVTDETALD